MRKEILKVLFWVGRSPKDLKAMSEEVMDAVGYALYEVQQGKFPRNAEPLTGIGASVTEIVCDFDKNTYRAFYQNTRKASSFRSGMDSAAGDTFF